MKPEYKIINIQKLYYNCHKATKFDVYQLTEDKKTWVYQFTSKIFAHRSTVAGIESQISREHAMFGHEAGYIL